MKSRHLRSAGTGAEEFTAGEGYKVVEVINAVSKCRCDILDLYRIDQTQPVDQQVDWLINNLGLLTNESLGYSSQYHYYHTLYYFLQSTY